MFGATSSNRTEISSDKTLSIATVSFNNDWCLDETLNTSIKKENVNSGMFVGCAGFLE